MPRFLVVIYKSKMGHCLFSRSTGETNFNPKNRGFTFIIDVENPFGFLMQWFLRKPLAQKENGPNPPSLMVVVFAYLRINPHSFPSIFTVEKSHQPLIKFYFDFLLFPLTKLIFINSMLNLLEINFSLHQFPQGNIMY